MAISYILHLKSDHEQDQNRTFSKVIGFNNDGKNRQTILGQIHSKPETNQDLPLKIQTDHIQLIKQRCTHLLSEYILFFSNAALQDVFLLVCLTTTFPPSSDSSTMHVTSRVSWSFASWSMTSYSSATSSVRSCQCGSLSLLWPG